ncbi:unnamed protein product, partial [Rotaria sp. Silwood2]
MDPTYVFCFLHNVGNKYFLFGVIGLVAELADNDCVCAIGLNIGLSLFDVPSGALARSIKIHWLGV